jgi:butyrate kinase
VDMGVLTGGLAYSSMLTGMIEERVKFIAPVVVHPGEDEMLAMAEGAYSVLAGEENALNY